MNVSLLPTATWLFQLLNETPALLAIRRALFVVLPLTLVGSFFLLLRNFPFNQVEINSFLGGTGLRICDNLISGSFGIAALAFVCALGGGGTLRASQKRNPAHHISPMLGSVVVLSSFFVVVAPADSNSWANCFSLDRGLLLAMLVALLGSALFVRLASLPAFNLPMEVAGHDPGVSDVFTVLPAAIATIVIFGFARLILTVADMTSLYAIFDDFLTWPFTQFGNGMHFGIIYSVVSQILWFFGAHGPNVLNCIDVNLLTPSGIANADAIANGISPQYVFTKNFFDAFTRMGGSGSTLSLCFALFLYSRDVGLKKLCLFSLLPALFNVNEPLIFGIPLVLNPIYFFPFVLVPAVQTSIAYCATALDLVPYTSAGLNWTTPFLISGYVATGSINGTLLQCVNFILGVAIYIPFVFISDAVREKHGKRVMQELLEVACRNETKIPGRKKCLDLTGEVGRLARALANDLAKALNSLDGQLYLVYQPQCDPKAQCVVGVEALLRWKHRIYGEISPQIVVSLAEDANIIGELGIFVLREACSQRVAWNAAIPSEVLLAVNVSPEQFKIPHFIRELLECIRASGLDLSQIELEITESSMLEPDPHTLEILKQLRIVGIKLAIDDFGMGHTSLRYLRSFPVTKVKIDRSLTENIDSDVSEQIVRSLFYLSKSLHIATVVEGIEDEEQLGKFSNIGYHVFQGYYFSKPLSAPACQLFITSFKSGLPSSTNARVLCSAPDDREYCGPVAKTGA